MSERSRVARRDVAEEGSNGGEAGIPRTRTAASMSFQVLKKTQNHLAVQIAELQLTWLAPFVFGSVEDQKAQAVPIGSGGQGAGIALLEEALAKE
jgi:hypothetical protein